jgi:hypothetical protein
MPNELRLEDARYDYVDLHPVLRVKVEGVDVTLDTEWKPSFRAAGIANVGSGVAGLLPPIEFKPVDGGALTLRGFTRDRRFVELYRRFWEACNSDEDFTPGPVPIPD